jgi:hypothetical protein
MLIFGCVFYIYTKERRIKILKKDLLKNEAVFSRFIRHYHIFTIHQIVTGVCKEREVFRFLFHYSRGFIAIVCRALYLADNNSFFVRFPLSCIGITTVISGKTPVIIEGQLDSRQPDRDFWGFIEDQCFYIPWFDER